MHIERVIELVENNHVLLFFYEGGCPVSRDSAEIVKYYANQHGFNILPISLDGGILPTFDHCFQDNGLAEQLGITTAPVLVAVHPLIKHAIHIFGNRQVSFC
jgi:conjugal transfer pilus assembly protein TraF